MMIAIRSELDVYCMCSTALPERNIVWVIYVILNILVTSQKSKNSWNEF